MIKNKTVYFLGAGASAASEFRLPTMKEFFKEFSIKEYPDLSRFIIKYYFPQLYPSITSEDIQELEIERIKEIEGVINNSELNVEEIFSYLDYYLSKTGKFGKEPSSYLDAARKDLKNYIFRRLNIDSEEIRGLNQDKGESETFATIFRKLHPQDSIITLNYDVIIERTLQKVWRGMSEEEKKTFSGDKVSSDKHPLLTKLEEVVLPMMELRFSGLGSPYYEVKETMTGVFLKLHGSLDWVYCPNESCINHFNIFRDDPINLAMQLAVSRSCMACGETLEIIIVPPSMHKVYEKFPKINFIWSLAHQELMKASKIVIIGVSFADTDFYLRGFFKSTIIQGINYIEGRPKYPQIEIVDKDERRCEAVHKKIKEIIGVETESIEWIGNLGRFLEKNR